MKKLTFCLHIIHIEPSASKPCSSRFSNDVEIENFKRFSGDVRLHRFIVCSRLSQGELQKAYDFKHKGKMLKKESQRYVKILQNLCKAFEMKSHAFSSKRQHDK